MKKGILLSLMLSFLVTNCSYYGIIEENNPSQDLRKYKKIYVGWLDLGEGRYSRYGFKSKGQWIKTINYVNRTSMPLYLKEWLPNKTISTAKSKNDRPPRGVELAIRFSNVEYNQRTSSGAQIMFGAMAGSDTLDMDVHFIDQHSGREIHKVSVSIYSKSAGGFSDMNFEGRIINSAYNIGRFLSKKLN